MKRFFSVLACNDSLVNYLYSTTYIQTTNDMKQYAYWILKNNYSGFTKFLSLYQIESVK